MGCCPGKKSNPPQACGTNCFRANNHAVSCDESVGPGGSNTKDLTTVNTSFNNCSDESGACTVTYQLVSYTAHFSSVTISEEGLVSYTLATSSDPNTLGTIRYRVYCNCNTFSASAKLFVCVKDLCVNEICEDGFQCNKTNGLCEAIIPNAVLT